MIFPVLLFIFGFSLFFWPHTTYGLVRPSGVGLDDKTLEVRDASKLRAMGMADVKPGDKISIGTTRDKRTVFINRRTGEQLVYPPRAARVPVKR
jgi:hypothetical protein